MSALRTSSRIGVYAALNVGFALLTGALALASDAENPRVLYLCSLFAVCSTPVLLADRLNGRFAILCAFTPLYFFFYGARDLVGLLVSMPGGASHGLVSPAELAILLGASLLIIGYRLAAGSQARRAPRIRKDWPASAALIVGCALCAAGALASWIWQVEVLNRAFAEVTGGGTVRNMAIMLGRMLQPLGFLLLAYRFVATRNVVVGLALLAALVVQFLVGFVGDSKEVAMHGLVMILMAKLLLEGRVPKTWFGIAALVVVLTFPVFQAYRTEVLGRGKDRGDAAAQLSKNLDRALSSRMFEKSGQSRYAGILDRSSLKSTMELIVERVGTEAVYQRGDTLVLFFHGFVPRVIWPDKPDNSVGQRFNQALRISEFRSVYISVTQLGEFYWNFGWPGLVAGMLGVGLLLGLVNRRFDLSEHRSVTRLLVVAVTIYAVCVRFEDGVAMTYTVWVRVMVCVALLHVIFARRARSASQDSRERLQGSARIHEAGIPVPT